MIKPHGGKLINQIMDEAQSVDVLGSIHDFRSLSLNKEQIKDVKNISRGVFSPLKGFLKQKDFNSVVKDMRLGNGIVWPIPIVLDINENDYNRLKNAKQILLVNAETKLIGVLRDIEIYSFDKDFFSQNVFGTKDKNHPGVEEVYDMKEYLIGGEIKLLDNAREIFPEHNLFPAETRHIFEERGWKTITAFQTRNVPHRGHEFLQKKALDITDGLFVQPVIGEKKMADFKDEYIITAYDILIDKYYPENRVLLGILPLKMRYAGPREAVFHAIIRKNFGCTHFIVGRDHAGVGDYYKPNEAQEIFDKFKKDEIGVEILKYPEVIFCTEEEKLTFTTDCAHNDKKISFSGSQLREYVKNKQQPPEYIIRKEVFNMISQSYNSLVDNMYKNNNQKKGFVLWFTGLSQSGKTTVADAVYKELENKGLKLERLDGDVARESLSADLGFTKQDRTENIKRVTFMSKLLSRNGVGVVCSFISPYQEIRNKVREEVVNFIEIYANAPVEVCEQRDTKGLYAKARAGEIKNFTGISDPYEAPENPEIELDTVNNSKEENIKKVINYLSENGFI